MKPVMLATDGSPTAEEATATAIDLARLLQTELIIVTVWDFSTTAFAPMGFAPVPMNGELAKLGEDQARKIAAEAAARAEEAGVETRSVMLRGMPVEEICIAAARFDPRFLIVGSHGWGAVKRAVFGSVSTGVLHHARCPVLVVRRDAAGDDIAANGTREQVHA
jgi:nucleotide-binding universal stress UspA family protein